MAKTSNMSDVGDMSAMYANVSSNATVDKPTDGAIIAAYAGLTALGISLNVTVLVYILIKKLWRNFVSSRFIAHLMLTNLLTLTVVLPVFIHDARINENLWESSNFMCRFQAFITSTVWSVTQLMCTCIAGVHLLTFARIHYEQLFGLRPSVICAVSWVIGFTLGLPCITNGDIVKYDKSFHYCIWGLTVSGYKFLTYLVLLGVLLPTILTWYAYARVLGILFHSPIVFEALGLYKSRWLVYFFMLLPLCQLPFLIARVHTSLTLFAYEISFFMAHFQSIITPVVYGLSLFIMKEEDMAVQARPPTAHGPYKGGGAAAHAHAMAAAAQRAQQGAPATGAASYHPPSVQPHNV